MALRLNAFGSRWNGAAGFGDFGRWTAMELGRELGSRLPSYDLASQFEQVFDS